MKKTIGLLMAVLLAVAGFAMMTSIAANADPAGKVIICHATGSETNPYVLIEVSENALNGHFRDGHQMGEDIINPPNGVCPGPTDEPTDTPTDDPTDTAPNPVVVTTTQTKEEYHHTCYGVTIEKFERSVTTTSLDNEVVDVEYGPWTLVKTIYPKSVYTCDDDKPVVDNPKHNTVKPVKHIQTTANKVVDKQQAITPVASTKQLPNTGAGEWIALGLTGLVLVGGGIILMRRVDNA